MNKMILLLGLLTAFGPLSIDMYLPALPDISRDFGVNLSSVQLSLASFLVGIAAGQIFYGPITDKWGRKKPLYVGLTLYAIASFLCAASTDVDHLIAYRFIQALGSCAGMVISRAVVRDLYPPHESAKIFSLLMLIMGVAPILAPVIGSFLVTATGWRSIFWVLGVLAILTIIAIHFNLRETHEPDETFRISRTLHNYLEILKDREFSGYSFSLSFIYAGMFAYITGSAFVFIEHYHLSPSVYSMIFGANAFGLIFFSQVNGRLLRKHTPQKLVKFALPACTLAGFVLLAEGIMNGPVWVMCGALFFYILTLGLIAPNGAACALSNQKKKAGSASALMGTIQFSIAAVSSSMVSRFHDGTIRPMTFVMCICAVLSLLFYYLFVAGTTGDRNAESSYS